MTIERKVGMGIAGQPSGGPTDVADVFSTYLYDGNGSTQTITNGIDLAGEGGLVWTKSRGTYSHILIDTVRGNDKGLRSDRTNGEVAYPTGNIELTAFNSDGYSIAYYNYLPINKSPDKYVSWTFRKKEKFFDVVTYTGNGVAGRQVAHDLGVNPALLMVKCTSAAGDWHTIARISDTSYSFGLKLNTTGAQSAATGPSSTVSSTWFVPEYFTGSIPNMNASGSTYVAYLFADNTAEDAEEQMIKCGSYTGDANVTQAIDLGWEPQWVLIKDATSTSNWYILDTMRGWTVNGAYGGDPTLFADSSNAESNQVAGEPTATGFNAINDNINLSGKTYIYMAIRAPMMVEPTAAIDVFNIDTAGANGDGEAPNYRSTFPVDFALHVRSGGPQAYSRLTGPTFLYTDSTNDEGETSQSTWDFMNGWYNQNSSQSTSTGQVVNMWKKAKGFFDVVAYTGTGSNRTVPHSLGVVPEMIWVKRRNGTNGWFVYTAEGAGSSYLHLQDNYNYSTNATGFNNTAATSSVFSVGTNHSTNRVSGLYIAYLFATLDGISKCGTYTGNGSSQTINCGFSAGARFVLIKRANLAVSGNEGNWYLWDTTRGIVAGNDPYKLLNTNAAEVTTDDSVDPANSGFIVNQVSATNINVSSSTYIFYAIA